MAAERKTHTAEIKSQVALAAVRDGRTLAELAADYGVHRTLIHAWKRQLLAGAECVFTNGVKAASADAVAREAELYEQIGRLKMEPEWMKKKVATLG